MVPCPLTLFNTATMAVHGRNLTSDHRCTLPFQPRLESAIKVTLTGERLRRSSFGHSAAGSQTPLGVPRTVGAGVSPPLCCFCTQQRRHRGSYSGLGRFCGAAGLVRSFRPLKIKATNYSRPFLTAVIRRYTQL